MSHQLIEQLNKLRGCVATVVTTGTVESMFASCHENLRSFNDRNGLHSVEYKTFPATLVETGRDAVIEHMLAQNYDYVLQTDADATFQQDALVKILNTAYNVAPSSDMVGGYCQLKGNFVCSIDTGTGTWEIHWPGEGVIPVIRTGAHFILVKRSAIEKMGPAPWFRTRIAPRALDVLAEMDGYARQHFSGSNPFAGKPEWNELLDKASKNAKGGPSSVGEDSAFCDRLRAAGGQIFVDTDITTGHVDRYIIGPHKLKEQVDKHARMLRLVCGVTE